MNSANMLSIYYQRTYRTGGRDGESEREREGVKELEEREDEIETEG